MNPGQELDGGVGYEVVADILHIVGEGVAGLCRAGISGACCW